MYAFVWILLHVCCISSGVWNPGSGYSITAFCFVYIHSIDFISKFMIPLQPIKFSVTAMDPVKLLISSRVSSSNHIETLVTNYGHIIEL